MKRKKSKTRYDVIVVGAGPGGCIAAAEAAKNGLDVLLIEKDRLIGTPVRCAEGVGHAGLSEFIEPDPKWITATIDGARFFSPDDTVVDLTTLGGGYILERVLFDRELGNQAAKAGVEILLRTSVVGLLCTENKKNGHHHVYGVKIHGMAGSDEIKANVVIAADGVESQVARWAGLKTALTAYDMTSNCQYHLANVNLEHQFCEFHFGEDVAPGGYAWVFPKGDGRANVGLGIVGGRGHQGTCRYLNDFIERRFPGAVPLGFTSGGVPVAMPLKHISTEGMMVVGDAARTVNPMTGAGIVNAMKSGREAAKVAVEAYQAGDFSANFMKQYDRRWHRLMGKVHRKYYRIREVVDRFDDQKLNEIAHILQDVDPNKLTLFEIFKAALRNHPKALFDLRYLLSIGYV